MAAVTLVQKLEDAFEQKFPGSTHPVHPVLEGSDRFNGFIVWDGFDGISAHQRQNQIWDVIRKTVDREEQKHIVAIFGMTPLEEQAILENEE